MTEGTVRCCTKSLITILRAHLKCRRVRLIHFQTAQCRSFALNVVCRRDSITFGLKEKPKCEARAEFTWMIYVENGQQHQAF